MINISTSSLDELDKATTGLRIAGWVVSPYLDESSISQLCRVFQNLARYRTAAPNIRAEGLNRANDEVANAFARSIVVYPRNASVVGVMMSLPIMQRFSHLFEMALLERYRLDMPAALMLATPLVEGVLLALSGWQFGNPQYSTKKAVALLQPVPQLSGDILRLFRLLHKQLKHFVAMLYAHTSQGLGVGNLNRHYIMHALGAEPVSFSGNIARVFMALEVLAALEQMNTQGALSLPDPSLLPTVNGVYRETLYEETMREGLGNTHLAKLEFLKHHPSFRAESYFGYH